MGPGKKYVIWAVTAMILVMLAGGCTQLPVPDSVPSPSETPGNEIPFHGDMNASEPYVPFVTDEMAVFFDSFDVDSDGNISLFEAREFFYWMEENVLFEHDDDPASCTRVQVGDGRFANHHIKTPYETWSSRAGDDEDMALLQFAFYHYHGFDTNAAWYNTTTGDHGVCIVKVAGTDDPEQLDRITLKLENVSYIQMEDGFYIIVDNGYSDRFGAFEPGHLTGQLIQV